MTRRETDGERISMWVLQYELDNHFSSVVRPSGGRKEISLAERIAHLIRKSLTKVEEGFGKHEVTIAGSTKDEMSRCVVGELFGGERTLSYAGMLRT